MKNICLIITGLSTGGAEIMLFKLLSSLDRRRFSATVISLTTKGEIGPRIEALGVPVVALGMRPSFPSAVSFIRLVSLLRKSRPDVVHTWMYHADLLGGLAARLAGVRMIVWGIRHSNLSPRQNKRSTLLTVRICARFSHWLPDRILSCSERGMTVHVDAGYCIHKFSVIPNGFDLKVFAPDSSARASVREELGLSADSHLVGLFARNDSLKNHFGFIDAAARLNRQLPEVRFLLVGTGIDSSNVGLVRAIEVAGLRERFYLLGRREDVPRLMASLDVLASSSLGEGFPNVLGEAMACSVPCVVTDVGDSAEIVGVTGRVVASGDMIGLARNLFELLVLPVEQRLVLGASARHRVRSQFDIEDVTRRYEEFYMHLVGEEI